MIPSLCIGPAEALEIMRKSPASFNPPVRSRGKKPISPKKRIPWTKKDELTLREAVDKYGPGNWKKILEKCKFEVQRSNVDIKDKWRNINKNVP